MANPKFSPPPIQEEFLLEGTLGRPYLNPSWLQWFNTVAQALQTISTPSGEITGVIKNTDTVYLIQSINPLGVTTGIQTATMTNAPITGNPFAWATINVNNAVRYVPFW